MQNKERKSEIAENLTTGGFTLLRDSIFVQTFSMYQMAGFTATLLKFGQKGEKTGWTYIEIPVDVAEALRPGVKQSFRVKGTLDDFPIKAVALVPMGDGVFILAINAAMRKGIRKAEGATVHVKLEVDEEPLPLSADLLESLEYEPKALEFFQTLPKGHQNYFSNWIESAKTPETKAKRIAQAVRGLAMGMGYGEMVRYFKNKL